jgi:peptide/nickel transport system ATP-binding protein/oligopeptide transport system ATP-binding protein
MVAESNPPVNTDNNQVKELVKVNNLVKYYPVRGGILRRVVAWVQAVDDVPFTISEGETLGLVGESGCGKSTVGNCILRLMMPTSGTVELNGDNIYEMSSKEVKLMRRNMQVIFQDPYSSLNPRKPIGDSILAGLKIH